MRRPGSKGLEGLSFHVFGVCPSRYRVKPLAEDSRLLVAVVESFRKLGYKHCISGKLGPL